MKTRLLTSTFLLLSIALFAQIIEPTRYFLDSLKNITNEQNSRYIRVVQNYKSQPNLFLFTDYYTSGTINMKAISTDKERAVFEGPKLEYYESGEKHKESNYIKNKLTGKQIELYKNGNKKQESNYVDNKLNGELLEWYENGETRAIKETTWDKDTKTSLIKINQFWNKEKSQTVIDGNGYYEFTDDKGYEKGSILNGEKNGVWEGENFQENFKYSEVYQNGKLISGISTDKENNKYPYKVLNEIATYSKGMPEFYRFIGLNYRTPNIKDLKGKIYIQFIINKNGNLSYFNVTKDLGFGTAEEAVRVLKKSENWIPGKLRGIPVKSLFNLPISIHTAN